MDIVLPGWFSRAFTSYSRAINGAPSGRIDKLTELCEYLAPGTNVLGDLQCWHLAADLDRGLHTVQM